LRFGQLYYQCVVITLVLGMYLTYGARSGESRCRKKLTTKSDLSPPNSTQQNCRAWKVRGTVVPDRAGVYGVSSRC
jgi:hypothetical protein